MSLKNKSFYWVGEPPTSNFCEGVILVNQIEEVPVGLGGMVCISYSDTQQINHALKAFFKRERALVMGGLCHCGNSLFSMYCRRCI